MLRPEPISKRTIVAVFSAAIMLQALFLLFCPPLLYSALLRDYYRSWAWLPVTLIAAILATRRMSFLSLTAAMLAVFILYVMVVARLSGGLACDTP